MSASKTLVPTTNGENWAIEFTSRSINGHSRLSLMPPYPYSDRFNSRTVDRDTETTPVTSLTPKLVLPHVSRDTVIYTLPLTGGATRGVLYHRLWKTWYPLRPMKLRNFDDEDGKKSTKGVWASGERFFALPVSVRDFPEPDERGQVGVVEDKVSVKAIGLMADFHRLLVARIGELGDEIRGQYGRSGADGMLGNAFARTFIVLDRNIGEDVGDFVMLFVIRSDAVEELGRNDQFTTDEAIRQLSNDENKVAEFDESNEAHHPHNEPVQWQIRRMKIEDIVRVVAALDDPERLQGNASVSEEFVRRFDGGGGKE